MVAWATIKKGIKDQWFNHDHLFEAKTVELRRILTIHAPKPTRAPVKPNCTISKTEVRMLKMINLVLWVDKAEIIKVVDDAIPKSITSTSCDIG